MLREYTIRFLKYLWKKTKKLSKFLWVNFLIVFHYIRERVEIFMFFFTYILLNIIIVPFCFLSQVLLPKMYARKGWESAMRFILKVSMFFGRIKITVDGFEHVPGEKAIFAADHRSVMDSFVMLTIMDRYFFMMVPPLDHYPWYVRFWVKHLAFIPVFRHKRDEDEYSDAVVHEEGEFETIKRIEIGESFVIYPEGHHERHHHLERFNTEAVKFAIKAKVPIIPVAIIGTEKVITPEKHIVHIGKVHIKFSRPIYYDEYFGREDDKEALKRLTHDLRRIIDHYIHHKM